MLESRWHENGAGGAESGAGAGCRGAEEVSFRVRELRLASGCHNVTDEPARRTALGQRAFVRTGAGLERDLCRSSSVNSSRTTGNSGGASIPMRTRKTSQRLVRPSRRGHPLRSSCSLSGKKCWDDRISELEIISSSAVAIPSLA